MIPFKKQFSFLILLAMNVQAMPQYDYPAYDEYGDIIQPFERPPVGTCSLPADLGGTGKKTHCLVELVSKELNHLWVIAGLFRQIGGHSSRFVLFCSF